ncbi:MAG: lipase [Propionibacteriales bacterium]|nr:lipase [Propionibacteriales bacterium]
MKRSTTVLAALALAVTTALAGPALTTPATGAGGVPVPEDDPFYAVPADVATYADGAVISSRRITALAYVVPAPTDAWQILYKTRDSHGTPTATVTTLMVPKAAWTGTGARPLVSYQTAEDGVAGRCAPSYGLRAGALQAGAASAEVGLMMMAIANGWAVSAPDYEGPESQFLAGRLEGQAVLDGVRASLAFTEARLPASTPVGLWGYSGGSFAASIAAQLEPSYAPEINLQAVALGGFVSEIRDTIDKFNGTVYGGAIAMGVNGPLRAFPEYDLGQYLSAEGKQKVAAASGDCIADAVARYPFLDYADIEAYPGAMNAPAVVELLHSNSPSGIPGTPSAPVYEYHAMFDQLAPIATARKQLRRYCNDGVVVQQVVDYLTEHISQTIAGAPGAVAFLGARFAGKAPKNSCSALVRE